jgi:hypothetical protein
VQPSKRNGLSFNQWAQSKVIANKQNRLKKDQEVSSDHDVTSFLVSSNAVSEVRAVGGDISNWLVCIT